MSNALAIAAVTKTLYNLLDNEFTTNPQVDPLNGVNVTMQPPDAANNETSQYQVNLFLYHVMPNAAWRNMPLPDRALPGETVQPPLALNLYYMITAYAREQVGTGDIESHNLLGRTMRILFDHPVLSSADIAMPESDVQNQIERIRITMQPLNIEELYRLWTGFQTQYRLSVSYEVSVVLIESVRAVSKPLPVLQIGRDGRGATVVPDPFPYPVLFSVQLVNVALPAPPGVLSGPGSASVSPVALPGDSLIIQGHRLSGPTVSVSFAALQNATVKTVTPDTNTGETMTLTIPTNDPTGAWPYGYYMLSVQITPSPLPPPAPPFSPQNTNALIVALAPQIDTTTPPAATRGAGDSVTITLNTVQPILQSQQVSLLLNDQEIVSAPRTSDTSALTFTGQIARTPAQVVYTLRLRVDGVDSIPYVRTGPQQPWNPYKNPPQFDSKQQVKI